MKNFKIKDLMISVHPLSGSDRGYLDDKLKLGTMAVEAGCFAATKCTATKPDCFAATSCSGTRPDCFAATQCSGTRPDCFAVSKCSGTRPTQYFDGNAFLKQQQEPKQSGDLLALKHILAGMQGKKISV
ncbi:MAG: hypothetical protein JWM28_3270 [Chitinophagaceae bacterium]|nr:hypothetical protein [Chitinophagaceae bacterium]